MPTMTQECNYVEAVITRGGARIEDDDVAIYAIDFSAREAQSIVDAFQRKHRNTRPATRHVVSSMYRDMELHRSMHDNVPHAVRMQMVGSRGESGYVVNSYRRVPVPAFMFPSTDQLVDTIDIKRVAFHVGEGVSVNIDSCLYADDTLANHVYASAKIRDNECFATMQERMHAVMEALVECVADSIQ